MGCELHSSFPPSRPLAGIKQAENGTVITVGGGEVRFERACGGEWTHFPGANLV